MPQSPTQIADAPNKDRYDSTRLSSEGYRVSIATAISAILNYVWPDGSQSLDPIHKSLIEAVLSVLPPQTSEPVRLQLSQKYFVQWMSDGRINRIFFDRPECLSLIDDPTFADKLFQVTVFIDGEEHASHVTFYEGRIFSVELKLPRKLYKDKEYRVGAVTEGRAKDSFTAVIDRVTHGKETDIRL